VRSGASWVVFARGVPLPCSFSRESSWTRLCTAAVTLGALRKGALRRQRA
jgi:hypothetical protein